MILNYFTVLIMSALISCQPQTERDKFEFFLKKFESLKLPYSISESFLRASIADEATALDSFSISTFVEGNKLYGDGITLFDLYKYYPHHKFYIENFLVGLIVEKVGGAGGVEKIFYLLIYNGKGQLTDKTVFAKEIGDCSRLQVMTGEIYKSFEIIIKQRYLIGNCEDDHYTEEKTVKEEFRINPINGKIERL